MIGGLIASAVAPHTPRMGIEEKAPDFVRGLIAGLRELGEALRSLQPNLFVLQSAHWISTFNWYVTAHETHEGVCVADEAPDLIPGTPYRRKGDPEFARTLVETLNESEIPCGVNDSPHFNWDYAALVPLQYIDPEGTVPVVILPTVICSNLDECMTVGHLVHESALKSARRTAFIASCALSHRVLRGPDVWPTEELQAMDHRLVDHLCAGRTGRLVDWLPTCCKDTVAEMGGRPLSGMVGAMAALERAAGPLEGRQYGPYGQSSGSGNASVCVVPKAA